MFFLHIDRKKEDFFSCRTYLILSISSLLLMSAVKKHIYFIKKSCVVISNIFNHKSKCDHSNNTTDIKVFEILDTRHILSSNTFQSILNILLITVITLNKGFLNYPMHYFSSKRAPPIS